MLQYLLPALIPSWRFFDYIAPSPRIQFAIVERADDPPAQWREFRPRPARLSWVCALRRIFWNPEWNESLYLASCAESLIEEPSAAREDELLSRIANAVGAGEFGGKMTAPAYLVVRIAIVKREGERIMERVEFVAAPRQLDPTRIAP